MKGISNEATCKCRDHEFILRPLTPNLHHSKKVQLCQCQILPKTGKKKTLGSRRKCVSGFPSFNTDKNYATPGFILESQKQHFLENRNIYLKDHSKKARQHDEETSNLYFPAPRSNYDYCNVCCTSYTDYIQHIGSFQHHNQIQTNKSNGYIMDLERTFKNKKVQESPKRSIQQRYIQIDDESDLSSLGNKKLKSEQKTSPTENILIFSQNRGPQFKNYYQFNNYINADLMNNYQNQLTQQKNVINQNVKLINQHSQIYPGFGQYCQNQFYPPMEGYYLDQQSPFYHTQNNNVQHQFSINYLQQLQHLQSQNFAYLQSTGYLANMKHTNPRGCPTQPQRNYFSSFPQLPYFYFNNLPNYAW